MFFFFNDTATTEIYTLSLHDALPISQHCAASGMKITRSTGIARSIRSGGSAIRWAWSRWQGGSYATVTSSGAPARVRDVSERSEEHTSELQSLAYLVCRLLLEKKKRF